MFFVSPSECSTLRQRIETVDKDFVSLNNNGKYNSFSLIKISLLVTENAIYTCT